jgi:divalent metal cation (Fe/Co/Zn/Cd) transporter
MSEKKKRELEKKPVVEVIKVENSSKTKKINPNNGTSTKIQSKSEISEEKNNHKDKKKSSENIEQQKKTTKEKKKPKQPDYKVKIPKDARIIWSIQRFFLFSLVLTVAKIYLSTLSSNVSFRAIAIDAVLDLIVSGLGLYLIQWHQQFLEKLRTFGEETEHSPSTGTASNEQSVGSKKTIDNPNEKEPQELTVSQKNTMAIASIQGLILFIGGVIVFFQSIFTLQSFLFYTSIITPINPDQFSISAALILSGVISAKYLLYTIQKEDGKVTNNAAVRSIETNLKFDLIVNLSAWSILLITSFWYYPWIIVDQVLAIFIGFYMIISGMKYLWPLLKILIYYINEEEDVGDNEKEETIKEKDKEKEKNSAENEENKKEKDDNLKEKDENPKVKEESADETKKIVKEKAKNINKKKS